MIMLISLLRASRSFQGHRQSSRGLTLVELLIALAIGLLVTAAVIQLFIGSRATFNAAEALARVQESGRFAVSTIGPSIRSSKLSGICGGSARMTNHLNLASSAAANTLFSPQHAVRGWEYNDTAIGQTVTLDDLEAGSSQASQWVGGGNIGALPASIVQRALPSSDVLLIREVRPVPGITANDLPDPDDPNPQPSNRQDENRLAVRYDPDVGQIQECEIILVTNCNEADLFQVSSVSSSGTSIFLNRQDTGTCSPGNVAAIGSPAIYWSRNYGRAAQFHRFNTRVFFVGESISGEPALFSASFPSGLGTNAPQIEELVDGIENMQLLFGYSFPGDATPPGDGQSVNQWLTADRVPNWEYVVAIRIGLLVRSSTSASGGVAAQTFDIARTNVTHAPDARLRQAHNVSLSLRNRQIVR